MTRPELPGNRDHENSEQRRLRTLHAYQILDTLPERSFDDLTALAAHICDAPISVISLIDADRQWFKSAIGLPFNETSRDVAFCAHGILETDVFTVEDAEVDARFSANPLVAGDHQIRFYAGAPLIAPSGDTIGMLCVMDRRRRHLGPAQLEALRVLSRQVIAQLELRRHMKQVAEREVAANILSAIVESSDDAIIGKDLNSVVTSWNFGATRIFGFTADQMIGQPITRIIPAERHGEERHIVERIRSGEGIKHFETQRQTSDGRFIDVSVTASPIRNERGEVIGVSKIARDVSERNRTSQAQQISDRRYRALFDYAPDGILIADLDGSYLDANPSICQMLGYTREELCAMHSRDVVAESDQAEIAPTLQAVAATAAHLREWMLRRKDGTLFAAEVLTTLMPDGQVMGMVRDLTDRKRLERQSLRAQRMESIGTLAGGIAHDLNNVLAPILMSIEMLREGVTRESDRELLTTLGRSAQRGAELVRQVLSFARGVEGQRVVVNLIPLIQDLAGVIRDTFPKSIRVEQTHAPGLWHITGDATQMNQVLLNLCVNARDAMPDGGTLTIRLTNKVLDETYAGMNLESRPGAYVVIAVEDTGEGIPADIRERIFEPFFTTKEVGKGTGLGLSTTLAIVKSHGGFITVYSEMGQGTKFKIYLPALATASATEELAIEQTGLPRGNGELILVVDDEVAVRLVAQRTLERFGYRVMTAANGAEAVSLYAQHHAQIKVVLTDMAMPIMDGPALIIALKAMNPRVRIIGSSGLAANGGVARAVGSGIRHFAPKPYTADTLLQMLRMVLREPE